MRAFQGYLQRLQERSDTRFIIESALLTILSRFFLVLPVLIALELFGVNTGTPNIDVYKEGETPLYLFFALCIIAPAIETVLFQALPVVILSWLRFNTVLQIVLPALFFAYMHIDPGLVNVIGNIPIGLILTWAFVVKRKQSFWKALFVTFAIHALSNLFPYMIYLAEIL